MARPIGAANGRSDGRQAGLQPNAADRHCPARPRNRAGRPLGPRRFYPRRAGRPTAGKRLPLLFRGRDTARPRRGLCFAHRPQSGARRRRSPVLAGHAHRAPGRRARRRSVRHPHPQSQYAAGLRSAAAGRRPPQTGLCGQRAWRLSRQSRPGARICFRLRQVVPLAERFSAIRRGGRLGRADRPRHRHRCRRSHRHRHVVGATRRGSARLGDRNDALCGAGGAGWRRQRSASLQ